MKLTGTGVDSSHIKIEQQEVTKQGVQDRVVNQRSELFPRSGLKIGRIEDVAPIPC